jgi:CubicO group peptidase (beta-lactamase class C family)
MNRSIRSLPALLACAAAFAQAPAPPAAAGHWEGAIQLPGAELKVLVDLETAKEGWKGRISIPQQGAKDLALKDVKVEGRTVSFVLPGIPGEPSFKGELAATGATLAGTFTQGGQQLPFSLARELKGADKARAALKDFDAVVEKIRADWKVQGLAIAIVKGGDVVMAKGYGWRDAEKQLPMTADTLLPIGSSTKAFTTAVMAGLVDEGRLDWEKPVRTWIPWFKLQDGVATERMTPLDLVTHRSGMPRHDALWYNATLSRKDMVRRLQFLEPNKDFRTDFQYNNAMFLTAGYLTEEITGKPWEDNVRERIFRPLGMARANFSVDETRKDADFSEPYREEKDGTVKKIPHRSITNVGPAGSINASVNEMAAWLKIHLDKGRFNGKQVLSPTSVDFLHTPKMLMGTPQTKPELVPGGYAPGWFTDVYRGHLRVHHGGNIDGFSAMVMLVPGSDLGIVVLANMDGTPTRDLLPRHALDRLLGLEARDWSGEALKRRAESKAQEKEAEAKKKLARKTGTSPSHPLAEYAGDYEHPGYGVMKVALKDGSLAMTFNGITTPFEHWHHDVFNGLKAEDPVFEDEKLQFGSGLDGEIEVVQMALEPSVKPIVFTKKADARLTDPAYLQRFAGTYALRSDMDATFSLRGRVLVADIKGQPTYELVPVRGTRFAIKGLTGFFVQFKDDATAVDFDQPNGIFTARRK